MALTALVPVVGALVFMGEPSSGTTQFAEEVIPELLALFATGALFHVFGFVLNELADLEVDRASADLQDKPLVSGAISPDEARTVAVVAAVGTFLALALVTLDPWAHGALLGAILFGAAYDLWGKRMPLDLLLAGSITLLLLSGAFATGGFDPTYGPHVTLLLCVGGLQFLQNLYQNAIEGGLKDADHDAAAGARTFAAVLGVRVDDEGDLIGGPVFNGAALVMKGVQISLLLFTAVEVTDLSSHGSSSILWALLIFLVAAMVVTTVLMLPPLRFERSRLKRLFSIHELVTFAAIVTVFVPFLGERVALGVFLLPMVWFMLVNRLLFGGSLEPGV